MLKKYQRFRSEDNNVCIEEINKIAASPNDDKKIPSTDSIETSFAYGTSKNLVCKEEEVKCNNIKELYKNV